MWGWDESDWKSSSWKSWSDAKKSWSNQTWKERDAAASAETGQSNSSIRRSRLAHWDEGARGAKLQHTLKKNRNVSVFSRNNHSGNIPLVPFPRPCAVCPTDNMVHDHFFYFVGFPRFAFDVMSTFVSCSLHFRFTLNTT